MSVAMTTDAVLERRKNVTRRLGWWEDKNGRRLLHPGDRLTLCEKVQGRKPGEPLVRLAEVEVVDVRREPLEVLLLGGPEGYRPAEIEREGFPGMDPAEFVRRFFVEAQGTDIADFVTRIEWRYLTDTVPVAGRVWTDDAKTQTGRRMTVKRCCNGCGRAIGDALQAELGAVMTGFGLPDVRTECGCGIRQATS